MIVQVILSLLPFQSILTSFDRFFDQFGKCLWAKPKKSLKCISLTLSEYPYQISTFPIEALKIYASFKHSDDDDILQCFLFISLQIRTFEQPYRY